MYSCWFCASSSLLAPFSLHTVPTGPLACCSPSEPRAPHLRAPGTQPPRAGAAIRRRRCRMRKASEADGPVASRRRAHCAQNSNAASRLGVLALSLSHIPLSTHTHPHPSTPKRRASQRAKIPHSTRTAAPSPAFRTHADSVAVCQPPNIRFRQVRLCFLDRQTLTVSLALSFSPSREIITERVSRKCQRAPFCCPCSVPPITPAATPLAPPPLPKCAVVYTDTLSRQRVVVSATQRPSDHPGLRRTPCSL